MGDGLLIIAIPTLVGTCWDYGCSSAPKKNWVKSGSWGFSSLATSNHVCSIKTMDHMVIWWNLDLHWETPRPLRAIVIHGFMGLRWPWRARPGVVTSIFSWLNLSSSVSSKLALRGSQFQQETPISHRIAHVGSPQWFVVSKRIHKTKPSFIPFTWSIWTTKNVGFICGFFSF